MTKQTIPEPAGGEARGYTEWVSLPPLEGGLWVAMVTEVLDDEGIPNLVKTDLAAGGLGVVMGTDSPGKQWRIQVPAEYHARALDIFDSLMGQTGDEGSPEEE